MKQAFTGAGIALVTPFKSDNNIDYTAIKNIIDFNIDNQIDYIIVHGTTAETATQSEGEKKEVRAFIADYVQGRVPLALGMGSNNTNELLNSLETTDLKGYDAILSVTPYYNKPQQKGIIAHFTQIANKSPLPVILYNVPGRTGVNMLADTTLELAHHQNILAIKEASGNMEQIMEIIKHRPEGFLVLSGDDLLTFSMLALGADGVISVAAQAAPKIFSQMVHQCLNGNFEDARKSHFKMMPYMQLLFVDGNPAGIKAALESLDLCLNKLRLPLVNAHPDICEAIEQSMASFK